MKTSDKLLVTGDYPLIASPTLAKCFGIPAALFLQKLHYCLQSKDALTYKRKKYWYHTFQEWVVSLGFYSIATVKRVVNKLLQLDVIIVQKLANNKWLRTNYYTINYSTLKRLLHPSEPAQPTLSATAPVALDEPQCSLTDRLPTVVEPVVDQSPEMVKESPSVRMSNPPRVAFPTVDTSVPLQGTDDPIYPAVPKSMLADLSVPQMQLYKRLIALKVHIAHDDRRLKQWAPYIGPISQLILAVKQRCGGIERYRWHTPEQLGLQRFTL